MAKCKPQPYSLSAALACMLVTHGSGTSYTQAIGKVTDEKMHEHTVRLRHRKTRPLRGSHKRNSPSFIGA